MDILKMLSELRSERSQIEEAILVLERLVRGQGKRRGRPPKWMTPTHSQQSGGAEPAKKRLASPGGKRRIAEGQRKRRRPRRQGEGRNAPRGPPCMRRRRSNHHWTHP